MVVRASTAVGTAPRYAGDCSPSVIGEVLAPTSADTRLSIRERCVIAWEHEFCGGRPLSALTGRMLPLLGPGQAGRASRAVFSKLLR